MICGSCGHENPDGQRFCGDCGNTLANACPSCGKVNSPGQRFCGDCGSALDEGASLARSVVASEGEPAAPVTPVAERRLVSVLFADLVGFTTLSEARDSEEVRELLSKYFDTCRTIITRYGGTVEKFIGDAVMAVWGAPVATEDDAERAVRAALELTAAVAAMGEEAKAPELRARAGVLTGEAAVNIGAVGEGMVAGDMVNTASRIQSAAEPGAVFVGEATKRSIETTVVFEPAGEFELKGKVGLTPLWRAVRVVAGARGSLKSSGLEPPFVGRDRELRVIKELFHASADEGKAHLVSVTGIAGIGKSRLSWEFYKYFDGLQRLHLYHRGRCISYGEGVAYWALSEMVKMRCRIAEEEGPTSAIGKLRSTLEEYVPDREERVWIEPRLAHLLGLEERAAADKEDLFAAWRLFIERMAEQYPVVMIFEDLQWADAALLDFIEYLLEWSRNHRIFVLTLGRPELAERRPNWGAGKRNFTPVYLEALSEEPMGELLSGLVPGLPDEVSAQILERAQGVPLYAVETVRMLLDRGLLRQEGNVYRPTGPIEKLEVPETLHALIAARLDGLTPEERHVVQDGAVLGKTFFKEGLARVSGLSEHKVEEILSSLVRKEVLSVQADPRSPERGQYGFLQDLLKTVAYDTLSKHDRKTKHLAAAAFIEATWAQDDEEVVEVLASHYLQAFTAAPDADDAQTIRQRARDLLSRAGERAASLAAVAEARGYFERAAEITEGTVRKAELFERAGQMAIRGGEFEVAEQHLDRAIEVFEAEGQHRRAARATARLSAEIWAATGRLDEAVRRTEESYVLLSEGEQDEDLADLTARLARMYFFAGDLERSNERNDTASQIAESMGFPDVLARTLNTKGIIALTERRPEEAQALLSHAMKIATEHDLTDLSVSAYFNLAEALGQRDRYDDAIATYESARALAHRVGDRPLGWATTCELAYLAMATGRWDQAMNLRTEVDLAEPGALLSCFVLPLAVVPILVARGQLDEARSLLASFDEFRTSADLQTRGAIASAVSALLLASGTLGEAVEVAREALAANPGGPSTQTVKIALVAGTEAALAAADVGAAEEFLDVLRQLMPGEIAPFLRGQDSRLRSKLQAVRGDDAGVEGGFRSAVRTFTELGVPFWRAVTLLEHGEWLAEHGRLQDAEPLVTEARQIFEPLQARPWIERLEQIPFSSVKAEVEAAS